jgi:Tfp pilus assembly protein PilO
MLKVILYILIIAAVIDAGIFLTKYFNQTYAADALAAQIQSENRNISTLTEKTSELNLEIANHTADVSAVLNAIENEKVIIPAKTNTNEIVKTILNTGLKNNVSVIPLSTRDWSTVRTGGNDYQVFVMSFEVDGGDQDVVQFVRAVQELYSTLVLENIVWNSIDQPAVSADMPVSSGSDMIRVNLVLAIYAK